MSSHARPLGGEDRVDGAVAEGVIDGGRMSAEDAVEARAEALDGGARAGVARVGLEGHAVDAPRF